jgi:signal transduction histidine kinase
MGSASVQAPHVVDATAKQELLEAMLGADDVVGCVERSLAWLAEHAGVTHAICALADSERGELIGVGGHRVTPAQIEKVTVGLGDTAEPWIQAMGSRAPRFFRSRPEEKSERTRAEHPFGRSAYWAFTLGASKMADRPAEGLLLLVISGEPTADLTWAADVLTKRLRNVRARQTQAEGESQLHRERSLLHAIINAVADPLLLTNSQGRLLIANAPAESLFSNAAGQSEGRRRAVELNNMFLSAALWRIAVGSTEVAPQELPLVDPADGSDLLFELLGTVVHDPREGTGIVSVLRNVTDLRRATEELAENYRRMRMAEAEVRAERDRLDLIIDSVADPIMVSDNAGKITLMNPPAERLFNARSGSDESAQRRVRANDAHFSSFISGLLSAGGDVRRRGEMSLTDVVSGTALPVEAIAGKVLSEFGELIAVVTILHDRSEALERSRLYEQVKHASDELEAKVVSATAELARQNELLRRQAVELEQASALKSQFLANMSHEFRTPLNAILGYTSLLLDGVSGTLTAGQRKSLERIGSNGRHLVGIISEILDLTRIEAGRMPLQLTRFTLPELIAEVIAEMDPIIARSKLTVSSQVSPKMGPIRSDRQKIKQIVLNLLSNALKFTPKGSVTIRVERGDRQKTVAIGVADTGIGINPADREKIFEDFRQVDSTVARPYGGTGLGLSICRRLARMLGGRIHLNSEPGRGSVFTLIVSSSLHK